jgi:hypothetical protein
MMTGCGRGRDEGGAAAFFFDDAAGAEGERVCDEGSGSALVDSAVTSKADGPESGESLSAEYECSD